MLPVLFNMFSKPNKRPLQVKNGTMDLLNWDFQKYGIVSLDGEWEFYWNQLLTYEVFHKGNEIKPDGYVAVPNVWTNYIIKGAQRTIKK